MPPAWRKSRTHRRRRRLREEEDPFTAAAAWEGETLGHAGQERQDGRCGGTHGGALGSGGRERERTGGASGGREGGDRAEGADWRQGAAARAVVRRGASECGVEPASGRGMVHMEIGTAKNRGWVGEELGRCCARPRWWAGPVSLRPERQVRPV